MGVKLNSDIDETSVSLKIIFAVNNKSGRTAALDTLKNPPAIASQILMYK